MGIAAEQAGVKCQNCKKSIAMLFPNSSCDCVGGIFLPQTSNAQRILSIHHANAFSQSKVSGDGCSRSAGGLREVDGDSTGEAAQTNLFSRPTQQGE